MTSDLNWRSIVWKSLTPGFPLGDISIKTCRNDFLVAGSFRSSNRLVEISRVTAEARPALSTACLAIQEANFVLLCKDVTELIVGTSLIFVPSGKFVEVELYHLESLSLTSCSLSTEHSTCKAFIFS